MRKVTVQVDSLTVQWQAPRGVDLECRGELSGAGVEYRSATTPVADVARQIPASVEPAPVALHGVTIAATAALIIDKDTGKYPHPSPFRDELERALAFAALVWGPDTPWEAIDESHWTKLLRRRCEELVAKNCKAVRATAIVELTGKVRTGDMTE